MNDTTEKTDSNEQADADAGVEMQAVVMRPDPRYQHQNYWVRIWRWWRWMPLHMALAVIALCRRGKHGMRIRDVFSLYKGLAHVEMQYTYTHEEVLGTEGEPHVQ